MLIGRKNEVIEADRKDNRDDRKEKSEVVKRIYSKDPNPN